MEIRIETFGWRQISGDMNPGAHGGLIATGNGQAIELIQIQPTMEYIGEGEALDLGFPFWSKEAYFDISDLDPDGPNAKEVASAMSTVGLSREDLEVSTPAVRALMLAEALVAYGRGDEGPAGYAKDIIGDRRVLWWGSKRPTGWRYLEDEDREFRRLLRERERD
jgi:hypothetical protein